MVLLQCWMFPFPKHIYDIEYYGGDDVDTPCIKSLKGLVKGRIKQWYAIGKEQKHVTARRDLLRRGLWSNNLS